MATQSKDTTKTIEITNFGGRLTRIINGDLNSGFAKFTNSWGYDPFSKPGNLTWLETANDITQGAITDLILAGIPKAEGGILYIYAIGSTGKLYKIQTNSSANANVDSVVGISSVKAGGITFNYGASMQLYNYTTASSIVGKIYVGGDGQVNSINTDGSGDIEIGSSANYVQNRYRPLAQFAGKLVFGNSNAIGVIDSTNTVTSPTTNPASIYSQLNPQFPPETYITDLDVSPDGNYLMITTSGTPNEEQDNYNTAGNGALQPANASNGNIYYWNGADMGATSSNNMGSFSISALQAYLQQNMLFINDAFGSSINNGSAKIVTLPNSKSPFPNATAVNGNFLTWIAPETTPSGTGLNASLFYYGNLDGENQPGLWRVMQRNTNLQSGFIVQTPLNMMVNSKYTSVNSTASSVLALGYGKHYFSMYDANSNTNQYTLQRFLITPTGTGSSQFGVYETQTQLFSRKITVKQVRVYCEPTMAGNAFTIAFIGSNGQPMNQGPAGEFKLYQYVAGTGDPTLLQGSLDRIDFNPTMQATYALGVQIQNTGNINMTIKKIEIDYEYDGK